MPLSLREYKYWITKNCPRNQCWIAYEKIEEILSVYDLKLYHNDEQVELKINQKERKRLISKAESGDTTYSLKEIDIHCKKTANKNYLGFGTLQYIYTVKLDDDRVSVLLEDEKRFYCVDNTSVFDSKTKTKTNTNRTGYRSNIYIIDSLLDLYKYIPSDL